jgi:uncharacterized protein (TIGR03435 family)
MSHPAPRKFPLQWAFLSLLVLGIAGGAFQAKAQGTFDVASIRPTQTRVNFEKNGITEVSHGTVRMRDVNVSTIIHWAYGTQPSQILGPSSLLKEKRYDIMARANDDTTTPHLRLMMQTLLADRFKLAFHHEQKEMRIFSMTIAKSGLKMKPSATEGEPSIHGIPRGVEASSITMREFVDYMSDPVEVLITDDTGLKERYDLRLDFAPYVPVDHSERPDPAAVFNMVLQGELGLKLTPSRQKVDVLIVDHVEPPSEN